MITINLEGKEYKMPNNWDELKLYQYMQTLDISENENKDDDNMIKLISILSDIPEQLILDIPYTQYYEIENACRFLLEGFDEKPTYTFTLNDIKYGMDFEIEKMSTGEFLDLDFFSKNPNENLHFINAILYRPIIKEDGRKNFPQYTIEKYDSKSVLDRAEIFKNEMPAKYALSSSVFFSLVGLNYLTSMEDFSSLDLSNQMKKSTSKKKNIKKISTKNGDGNTI